MEFWNTIRLPALAMAAIFRGKLAVSFWELVTFQGQAVKLWGVYWDTSYPSTALFSTEPCLEEEHPPLSLHDPESMLS